MTRLVLDGIALLPPEVEHTLGNLVCDTDAENWFAIKATGNKGEIQYLVGEDYFLPHCRMDADSTIYDKEANIKQSLHDDFSIQEKDIIEIVPLDQDVHFSIKPIHGTILMNAYVFYYSKGDMLKNADYLALIPESKTDND